MAKPENGYEFKVNGEQFEAGIPELTALEVLGSVDISLLRVIPGK